MGSKWRHKIVAGSSLKVKKFEPATLGVSLVDHPLMIAGDFFNFWAESFAADTHGDTKDTESPAALNPHSVVYLKDHHSSHYLQ